MAYMGIYAMSDAKRDFCQLLTHLEAADAQFESLERLGPIEDLRGQPFLVKTEAEKERLRKVIDQLSPLIASLRNMLND
jgi:hypothetical protein